MAMRLDASDVMRRVLDNPALFPVANDVDVVVRKLVAKRLKDKALTLTDVQAVCGALGEDNFRMLADGMTDAEAKALLAKVDKSNKEVKSAPGAQQRILVVELATGRSEPMMAAVKAAAAKKPRKTKDAMDAVDRALNSKATKAKRLV